MRFFLCWWLCFARWSSSPFAQHILDCARCASFESKRVHVCLGEYLSVHYSHVSCIAYWFTSFWCAFTLVSSDSDAQHTLDMTLREPRYLRLPRSKCLISSSRSCITTTIPTPPLSLMRLSRSSPREPNTTKRTFQLCSAFEPLPLMSGEVALRGEGATVAT
jgi:hypothetical protein